MRPHMAFSHFHMMGCHDNRLGDLGSYIVLVNCI
ncbi:hypothetical protein NC652_015480 [Populus alba x Populus x berolinensis]|uniref:Uncharacterized protein n=1 Tax=Populus alba x Populus x berolinensis TaxID=444605 RepID=A0AAD6QKG0_9ROSI|nr:hypothetical protein NC652_015480 [Populus alba x Populus x berolinensis]KAJ6992053.1 hypothetical protein NC653_015414 [Populus alba x Populus x berolinensis]